MYFYKLIIIPFICVSLLLRSISIASGRGSGTSLPGLIVERYTPWLLGFLGKGLTNVIMISGTNGKTTTRSLINQILQANGTSTVSNLGGANIIRGIASTLLNNQTLLGNLKNQVAVLEVEEASLPILTRYIKPDFIVLTNIFRDQLDAYGEIDKTLSFFRETLVQTNAEVIINIDDKKLLSVLDQLKLQNVTGFSLPQNQEMNRAWEPVRVLPTTQVNDLLVGEIISRPEDTLKIGITLRENVDSPELNLGKDESIPLENIQQINVSTKLNGIHNAYNVLAAVATCRNLVNHQAFDSLVDLEPVFGRGEVIKIGDTTVTLILVKNPAGYGLVLNDIKTRFDSKNIRLVCALNDKIADGKDISWIWDVNFEDFFKSFRPNKIMTTGTRYYDMMLRIQYAGIDEENLFGCKIEEIPKFIQESNTPVVVLCTYTVLREIRGVLGTLVDLKGIAEDGN